MAPNPPLHQTCLKVLAAIGPLSWLLLGLYLLTLGQQMWVGLVAFYYSLPAILIIHIIAPLGLLWLTRHSHPLARRGWVCWSLIYYVAVPGLIVGLSIWFQGLTGTLELIARLLREIRFQLGRSGWRT
ncbi:hypothetical protein [Leptolyngbya sp. CCY15150]|uniref:hypothetical protein n=1 Tax=Leptolyngbya sp. CCY15150 TaxID=2767772 RepID=UPI0019515B05|nr:hypothetical protein [Leptolyngbya sp. CCY15150]